MTTQTWLANIRVTETPLLQAYVEKRFPKVGRVFDSAYIAYHAWRPGIISLSESHGTTLARATRGGASAMTSADLDALAELPAWRERGFVEPGALRIDELVSKMGTFPAIQNPFEAQAFLTRVAERKPKTVVEIGTAGGGMLYCLCQVASDDAVLVSIDVGDGGDFGGGQTDEETRLFDSFRKHGQKLEFIRGSSLAHASRERLRGILDGRLIDVLFVDGDHNYGAVKADVEMYRTLVRPGGMIVFHDICVFSDSHGPGLEVGTFWEELKAQGVKFEEFIDPNGARSRAQHDDRLRRTRWYGDLIKSGAEPSAARYLAFGSDFIDPARVSSFSNLVRRWYDVSPEDITSWVAWGIGVVYA